MELQLVALLLLASPMSASHARFAHFTARNESISAIDSSTARRFHWIDTATRPPVRYADDLARNLPPLGLPAGPPLGIVRAAEWVDSLPFSVGAQDGGLTLALRFRV